MKNDLLFFRKLMVFSGGVIVSGSMGIMIFEWLGSDVNHNIIALIAGISGGITWLIEKHLLLKKIEKREK